MAYITPENLKNLIKLRFSTLKECADELEIDSSTLTQNIKNNTRRFLIRLKNVGVLIPDELINPPAEKIKVYISKDGIKNFAVKDNSESYDVIVDLQEEIKSLKAENYDLKKKLEELRIKN